MLWGEEEEITTPCNSDVDPFHPLADGSRLATETHVLNDRRVGLGGMLRWGLRPQLENALEELRAEALEKGKDVSKVSLTENDIFTAWTMDSNRTVAASIAMSLRKAFDGDPIPSSTEHPYVGNAFGWANFLVTAGEVASKPLSCIARQYEMVLTSTTGLPIVIFGDGGMAQVGFSNWSKAGLLNLDFAPARKLAKEGLPCRPSYVQENHRPIKPVDGFFIFGKDDKGDYWTSAYKVKVQWAKFEEQLDADFENGV
ncbi:hypothetical protein GE09DRAFT_1178567 [Coniochaeta sp. 2T2.1]|nr:hypothetical protein GE09DRAFT_1178567 [Coniochaeta sp. 2T2.1]